MESARSGNTEVTESVNSLAGYEVPEEVLQTALKKEINKPNATPSETAFYEEESTAEETPVPFDGATFDDEETAAEDPQANPTVDNFLQNPSSHNFDLYVESRDRFPTPQHLVEVDEILYGTKGMDWDDQHATIEEQAEDYIYKLNINRNPLVNIHAKLNLRTDLSDFDEINEKVLLDKPTNFHIIGKPGVGSTTFATKFATKMNLIYVSPVSAVEYFTDKQKELEEPPPFSYANVPREMPPTAYLAKLGAAGIDDSTIFEFVRKRIEELDVQHKGYILDGWPILRSEELTVDEQLDMVRKLPNPPDIIFIMQMQNRDLYKRRVDQKMDPMTSIVYTKKQYIRPFVIARETAPHASHHDISNMQSRSKVSLATGVTMSVTTISSTGLHDRDKTEDQRLKMEEEDQDFLPLQPLIVGRLISRLEDHPVEVHQDFANWRSAIASIQQFLNSWDRTKIFELDSYQSPKVIVENALKILSALGILPAPVPLEISHPIAKLTKRLRPEDEVEGYSDAEEEGEDKEIEDCLPDDGGLKENVDWAPILRAIVLIARIDPRFRWRISRWKNLCPVALKEGRSVAGNPQRAYGLYDKVYFLSTEEAVKKFAFNPRRYLIPDMPTSPIKFFVIGHPLAGKTLFAHELATLSGGRVIDMKRQTRKCLECVKQRFLFKTRFEATMEAKKKINKKNYEEWKRQERLRREKIHKWIAEYQRRRAAEEINAALELEREERMKEYRKLRWKSEFHELSAPFKSSPCNAEPLAFSWKKFVEDIKRGVDAWSHQERLELAWELFREGRLRYKMKGKPGGPTLRRVYRGSEDEFGLEEESGEDHGEESPGEGGEGDGEELGEGQEAVEEEEEVKPRRKRRHKKKKKCRKPAEEVAVVTDDEQDSSPLPSDAEPDESLRLRYPDMCPELTEPIPKPGEVEDQNEQVQAYVREKVAETEKWIATLPSEVYEEILSIGIQEAERHFREKFPNSHLSGGWIVENMIEDVEKWRSILRNPALCPDQVFVLQDTSTDYSRISNRLKKLYAASIAGQGDALRVMSKPSKYAKEYWSGGEDSAYPPPEYDYKKYEEDVPPEDDYNLPHDTLLGQLCATASEAEHIMMDVKRHRSRVVSDDSQSSDVHYENLGKVSFVDKKDVEMSISMATSNSTKYTKMTTTTTTDTGACKPLWHSAASLHEIGIIPGHKLEVYEMRVMLPLSEAQRRTAPSTNSWNEYEGESTDMQMSSASRRSKEDDTSSGPKFSSGLEEYMGEGGDGVLEEGKDSNIATPSGLNTPIATDLACNPEDEDCQETEQPMSLKKSFLKQVSNFDDFWNMVFPVVSAQRVGVFMVGIVDEESAKAIAKQFWDELQGRFALPPAPVTLGDLEEDEADVRESRGLWTGKKDEDHKLMPEGSDFGDDDDDEDEEGEDEHSEGEYSDGELSGLYVSKLKGLENVPDTYRAVLQSIEENQLFGDYRYYCPVTLADRQYVRKGSPRYAVRFQDRLYYLANHDAYVRFMANPKEFLPPPEQKCVPPPRICITGPPGCDQRGIALLMSERAGIYFVDFRERLQELMKSRLGRDVGPFHSGEIVTRPDSVDVSEDESRVSTRVVEEDAGEASEGFDPNTEWIKEKRERKEMEKLALKSLAIADKANIETFPIDSVERTEAKANRAAPPGRLTQKERYIKNFLETGAQLPAEVLDDFIPQLWKEEPFKSTGFILVGFPNTPRDIQYMVEKECFPEFVYIMECKKKTCRNRLIRDAMKRWQQKEEMAANADIVERMRRSRQRASMERKRPGELLSENRETKVGIWCSKEKACMKAAKALYHYYYNFNKKITTMKMELNQRRIDWTSIHTDKSLFDAKGKLVKMMTPALKYRRSFFEATHVLYPEEAETLLQQHYFHLSKFSRWCPVEVSKGNQGINLWNASGVQKYPVLHRNYIYFVAGEENLEAFRSQVLDVTDQSPPLPSVPVSVVILGPPKAGKTELCRRLAKRLGLLYISEDEVIGNILRHSLAFELDMEGSPVFQGPQPMIFAQKVHTYLKKGHSVPQYMFYRSLDYALLHPLAQHHGFIFDGYPMEDVSVQELLDRGVVPATVIKLDIELETVLQRCENQRRIPNYNYDEFVQDCDELMKAQYEYFGPMVSPCIFWYGQQMRALLCIDGTKNPAAICDEASQEIIQAQTRRQHLILNYITGKGWAIKASKKAFKPKATETNTTFHESSSAAQMVF